MKNLFTALALLLTFVLLATSCWKTDEDWSPCPPPEFPPVIPPEVEPQPTRLVLDFNLHDTPDARFTDTIKVVDVYLFDADMALIESRELTEDMLRKDLTTTWEDIEPGTYYALAWANVNVEDENTLETLEGRPEERSLRIESTQTGSPVYFAPRKTPEILGFTRAGEPDYTLLKAEVVKGKTTVKPMMFDKAHRTVDVFIRPGEWVIGELPGDPVITRSGAGGFTDFLNRNDIAELLTFTGPMYRKMIDREEWWTVHFHSAWLLPLEEYSGSVWIVNPDDGAAAPGTAIDLYDYVVANQIVKRYGDDSYIPIRYRISGKIIPDPIDPGPGPGPGPDPGPGPGPNPPDDENVSVHVELPPWGNHEVTPEF
jgi:hypothetical protein